jgi:hypothetical protein
MRSIADKLRHAAENPDEWDIRGLLLEAADAICPLPKASPWPLPADARAHFDGGCNPEACLFCMAEAHMRNQCKIGCRWCAKKAAGWSEADSNRAA